MANHVIDELNQLAPRIRAALEADRQADRVREERITQAETVLASLVAGLETIAAEIAATMGGNAAVTTDSTAIDTLPHTVTDPGSPSVQWLRGFRLAFAIQGSPAAFLNSVAGARLYADGHLQIVAAHVVGQRTVWFDERVLAVGSTEQESAAVTLLEELNENLPAAMRALSDLLPA